MKTDPFFIEIVPIPDEIADKIKSCAEVDTVADVTREEFTRSLCWPFRTPRYDAPSLIFINDFYKRISYDGAISKLSLPEILGASNSNKKNSKPKPVIPTQPTKKYNVKMTWKIDENTGLMSDPDLIDETKRNLIPPDIDLFKFNLGRCKLHPLFIEFDDDVDSVSLYEDGNDDEYEYLTRLLISDLNIDATDPRHPANKRQSFSMKNFVSKQDEYYKRAIQTLRTLPKQIIYKCDAPTCGFRTNSEVLKRLHTCPALRVLLTSKSKETDSICFIKDSQ